MRKFLVTKYETNRATAEMEVEDDLCNNLDELADQIEDWDWPVQYPDVRFEITEKETNETILRRI